MRQLVQREGERGQDDDWMEKDGGTFSDLESGVPLVRRTGLDQQLTATLQWRVA